eukprot:XP_011682810.1 PREDICTED: WD repeat-containing protein 38-like [Strongylocentrotus purpuratus]
MSGWLTGTPRNILTGHKNLVQCCAFSANDRLLATGSWDHTVRLWALCRQAGMDQVRVLKGHTGNVYAVAFSKLGMLATGSWDKTVRLWSSRDSRCLAVLSEHTGWVRALAFSNDSNMVASASDDETV